MGAIVDEGSKNSDKMTGGVGREEKILVLVRLRPLNDKEVSKNQVADWESINDSTILYRNSLQERSGLPTVYSFDPSFRIGYLGKVNMAYENDRDSMIRFYEFVANVGEINSSRNSSLGSRNSSRNNSWQKQQQT